MDSKFGYPGEFIIYGLGDLCTIYGAFYSSLSKDYYAFSAGLVVGITTGCAIGFCGVGGLFGFSVSTTGLILENRTLRPLSKDLSMARIGPSMVRILSVVSRAYFLISAS